MGWAVGCAGLVRQGWAAHVFAASNVFFRGSGGRFCEPSGALDHAALICWVVVASDACTALPLRICFFFFSGICVLQGSVR